ncbi:hypothetical protein P7C71_g2106, partial [Lecanoromycetidae sp. Uapishka_2]
MEPEKQDVTSQNFTTSTSLADNSSTINGNDNHAIQQTGWRYRIRRLGPLTIPHYASPQIQLLLVAFVCFLCPGMFNAVNGLGGGGQLNATTADNANVAVYATFSVIGFFAGTIANRLGIKLTLSLGGLGYSLYISSYLSYNHDKNEGFVVFSGAVLGVCAGMLWAAQGAIMMSYPHERNKGKYISWFWMIFNLGGLIGSLTRALNNLLYWLSQIIGAYIFGYALDVKSVRRSMRAKICWVVLFVITMAIWGGGYAWQKGYTRAETSATTYVKEDWTASGYAGPMFLYMFYGFYDAAWQTCIYWSMGALTNNGRKLANFAGFYKGIQSAGAAIIYRIDALGVPYMNEFASSWGLLAGSLLIALPLIFMKISDTVPIDADLVFTDETYDDVKPTIVESAPEVQHEKA